MEEGENYDKLVKEALEWRFSGWDFSSFKGRMEESAPEWSYPHIARSLFPGRFSLLDMGTGGGEVLSSLMPLPGRTVATEGYVPNLLVADSKLRPLGVDVVETYCEENYNIPQRGAMPFVDSAFDLIINRHESFVADEVARVLKQGGVFLTQQVDASYKEELNLFLGAPVKRDKWNLQTAVEQIEKAGLIVLEKKQSTTYTTWKDVGAVIAYLRMVEWQIADFDVASYDKGLRELDMYIRKHGRFVSSGKLFYLIAEKGSG